MNPTRASAIRAIVTGGFIAGALDITFAMVYYGPWRGRPALGVLQSVASGWLGQPAFDLGWSSAALGLLTHFCIALGAATTYFLASRSITVLRTRPLIAGMAFGLGVWLFMNFIVLPLSAIPFKPSYAPAIMLPNLVVHIILIGIPIALSASRLGSPKGPGAA